MEWLYRSRDERTLSDPHRTLKQTNGGARLIRNVGTALFAIVGLQYHRGLVAQCGIECLDDLNVGFEVSERELGGLLFGSRSLRDRA